MTSVQKKWLVGLLLAVLTAVAGYTLQGCAELGITGKDASTAVQARESVCSLARVATANAPTDPTLRAVIRACDAGDDLKTVARVYGGCEK